MEERRGLLSRVPGQLCSCILLLESALSTSGLSLTAWLPLQSHQLRLFPASLRHLHQKPWSHHLCIQCHLSCCPQQAILPWDTSPAPLHCFHLGFPQILPESREGSLSFLAKQNSSKIALFSQDSWIELTLHFSNFCFGA